MEKYKVIITDPIAEEGLKILESEEAIEVDYRPEIPFKELLKLSSNIILRTFTLLSLYYCK